MLRELIRYHALIRNLVAKDLKLKYRDSVLGVVWSLLNPLLMLTVYTVAFKYVLRIQMDHYAYFLLTGLLPWTFFAGSALASTGSVVHNANLIKKVYFPRQTLPIATVLFNFAQLLLGLIVLVPALVLVSGVGFRPTIVLLAPLLVVHALFTLGVAFVLSAVTTSFRDVAHLVEVALPLVFWLTPIIYPAQSAPAELQLLFAASPFAAFAIAYQDVLFWGRMPDAAVVSALVGWTAVALFGGHAVFRWYDPTFAEEV